MKRAEARAEISFAMIPLLFAIQQLKLERTHF